MASGCREETRVAAGALLRARHIFTFPLVSLTEVGCPALASSNWWNCLHLGPGLRGGAGTRDGNLASSSLSRPQCAAPAVSFPGTCWERCRYRLERKEPRALRGLARGKAGGRAAGGERLLRTKSGFSGNPRRSLMARRSCGVLWGCGDVCRILAQASKEC